MLFFLTTARHFLNQHSPAEEAQNQSQMIGREDPSVIRRQV